MDEQLVIRHISTHRTQMSDDAAGTAPGSTGDDGESYPTSSDDSRSRGVTPSDAADAVDTETAVIYRPNRPSVRGRTEICEE